MGLNWIRLDVAFFENPKVLDLPDRLTVVHLKAMAYTGKHGLDGFVPRSSLRVICATAKDAARLVDARLWLPQDGAGWDINGWAEFQPSTAEAQRRSDKARDAARARWKRDG